MSDEDKRRESTETIVRRHVSTHLQQAVEPRLAAHERLCAEKFSEYDRLHQECKETTREMKAQSMEQLQLVHDMGGAQEKVQEMQQLHTEIILGKLPPDPEKPGLWRITIELLKWKKELTGDWSKLKWIVISSVLGGFLTGLGGLMFFLLTGNK